ncbi:MAG: hypothetical protein NTU73_09315 [Ignavibacteriae bacterium]|nr:hypothetical protein [Ignavibacteriota bacterium]
MKKIIFVFLLLITIKGFSQDADSSDYFRVGLYGGYYASPYSELWGKNNSINSIAFEFEYVKLKNLAFYGRGVYQFTNLLDKKDHCIIGKSPDTYRIAYSFGARYYLKEKEIKPYFQLGLNSETDFIGDYSYYDQNSFLNYKVRKYSNYFYSLNIGAGLDIKIYKKIYFDFHYDLYRVFRNENSTFEGQFFLAGLKYNIVY